jgi:hypothetical protein
MRGRVLALVILMALLAACGGGGGADSAESGGRDTVAEPAAEEGAEQAEDDAGEGEAAGLGDGDTADAAAEEDQSRATPLPHAPPRSTADRIIKEGTISLEVKEDEFDRAFQRVIVAARQYGGDVVGSSTNTDGEGNTVGSVTVRVPVEDFEDLIINVGEIGAIRHRDIGSQDVTAEYTDLESRLRHERAQERFYLGLLDRAASVDDAIAVQQQLEVIQGRIERIQGRLNVLTDRTTFSTLTVELFEPGLGGQIPQPEDTQGRPSLARYWDIARDGFVNVVGAILVTVLFLLPLLIVAAASVMLWLVVRRTPTRRAAPPQVREEEEEVTASRH